VSEAAHHSPRPLLSSSCCTGLFTLESLDSLVCLDGGGPGAERLAELSAAIESRGARIYRFTAAELEEPLSILPLTVVVQRIAPDFATQLGTDPDNVAPPI